ncbi:AAA family ATPase [[Mycoplasma] gypis]|uniref:Chromosome partition protein Smc n=1 Tax=[Mycoplasma] gypis TaxID=92404 RepID=A0ABZ2RMX2_9BACT|nr:AAA family ATPase [[Mycoplasma] gypis]MBN0919539.1 AAA family ATPase [[Mycoplasma] gypis]
MKLIEVQAHGFKSFADKVSLKFDGGIVAIVGPNGSGKSNINDAIRWVLGESSSKALRGDNMEDVIFAGSESQDEMDKAEVILTFDNTDRAVSIPYDVFTISRVLHRGKGSNEYYINGELARMRDIKEIAMQSGISKSSLAIISQGTISDVAEATPERRREFFEEAAGTSMYKSRKAEAVKKLQKAEESLAGISTVVAEVEKQLGPLQRQAAKAKTYLEKTAQLKEVEVSLLVHELTEAKEKISKMQLNVGSSEENLIKLDSDIKELSEKQKIFTDQRIALETEILKLKNEVEKINEEITDLKVREAQTKQQQQWILEGKIQVSHEQKISTIKQRLDELNNQISGFKQLEISFEKQADEESQMTANLNSEIYNLSVQRNQTKDELSKVSARLESFKDMRDNKIHMQKATKIIVENSHLFKGYKGTVAQLLQVPSEYSLATEIVLANTLQNIVVSEPQVAVNAIEFLKKNKGGRTSFIPLSSIQERYIREDHIRVAKTHPGFIGILGDLITTKKEFDVLRKFLLGHIILANNIDQANQLSQLLEKRYMIVTLEGDIIRSGGVITGGQAPQSNNTFGLDEKIRDLESIIPVLQEKITNFDNQLQNLMYKKDNHSSTARELMVEISKLRDKRTQSNQEFDELKIQYESLTNEKIKLEENVDFINSIESLSAQRSQKQAIINTKQDTLREINHNLSSVMEHKSSLDRDYKYYSQQFNSYSVEKTKNESIIEQATKRLSEQYSLLYETAKEEFYNPEIDYSTSKKVVQELQQEIRELGNVNVQAIEDLKEIQERYDTVKATETELSEAKATIEKAIDEMDKIIISRIKNTVNLVNAEFKYVFNKMFGGGMAEIRYTDPENLLESGLDIIAQPPGKSIKNLKLFSGGEKALIAISLLFSILKAKPLPLCILDEVEAALDEANVIRFAEFLHKLKQDTQFIVITHRQGTMERVDTLYGATMQNRGVTTFFAVELAKAKELIDENQGEK